MMLFKLIRKNGIILNRKEREKIKKVSKKIIKKWVKN